MKKAIRYITAMTVALCLILTACAPKEKSETAKTSENTVTDGAGQVLTIPDNIDEYSISSVYAVSVPFIVALGLSDRVAAINVKSNFWKDADEDLASAGTVGRGMVDLEALAELAPTVLIHRSNDPKTVQAVQDKLGIEVFCITVEDADDIKNTLETMGKYFHKEDRVKEVTDWIDYKFAWMDELTKNIPENERKTALLMGGELGRVAGGDMLQSWMIEKAGGKCVAADTGEDHDWINVGVETVFQWNPDFLFLTSSTGLDYSPDELADDAVWSGMTAISENQMFQIPAKTDSWDMPGISCVLGTMYMLHCMYPELLDAQTLRKEVDEYYMFMFGKTFSADELGYSFA